MSASAMRGRRRLQQPAGCMACALVAMLMAGCTGAPVPVSERDVKDYRKPGLSPPPTSARLRAPETSPAPKPQSRRVRGPRGVGSWRRGALPLPRRSVGF